MQAVSICSLLFPSACTPHTSAYPCLTSQTHPEAAGERRRLLALAAPPQQRGQRAHVLERLWNLRAERVVVEMAETHRLLAPLLCEQQRQRDPGENRELVQRAELFRRTQPRVIREIVLLLRDDIFLPGDFVCRPGERGDSMHFIAKGECTVLGSDLEVVLAVKVEVKVESLVLVVTESPTFIWCSANTTGGVK